MTIHRSSKPRRLALVAFAVLVPLITAGAAASAETPHAAVSHAAVSRAALPHAYTVEVAIEKSGNVPNYVDFHTGDVVRFVNKDNVVHDIVFKAASGYTCTPVPLVLHPGGEGFCTFTRVGTYAYYDSPVNDAAFHGTIVVATRDVAATITSAASATFITGTPTTFTVEAAGVPAPTVTISGALPPGLSFSAATAGSATISGEVGGPEGTFVVTLIASNGVGAAADQTFTLTVAQPPAPGYVVADASGTVYAYGQAVVSTPVSVDPSVRAIVSVARSPGDLGYWLVTAKGGVYHLGGAPSFGSVSGQSLSAPISAFASTPDGKGYWLVSKDGTVYPFGDAHSYSSLVVNPGTRPIVAIASTPDGNGYWLTTSRGNVYNFGDAGFYGSRASASLPHRIVGFAASADGKGYYLVSSGGNVYNFGDAGFYGSEASAALARTFVGLVPTLDGKGYYLATSAGNIYNFGDARFYGSPAGSRLSGTLAGLAIPD